ncbi:MAG: ATP-binding cassette domain-containing protein, partial [Acidimicrobiia bacterium]
MGLPSCYDGRTVVDGVSFSVEDGEIFAILGPNGAGKTTTVDSIAGLRMCSWPALWPSGSSAGTDGRHTPAVRCVRPSARSSLTTMSRPFISPRATAEENSPDSIVVERSFNSAVADSAIVVVWNKKGRLLESSARMHDAASMALSGSPVID